MANPGSPTLASLRRQIDEIDDRLHDLLMGRAEVVDAIAGLKQSQDIAPFRPGREAQILRRLVARHRGRFPRPVLVRLWREMLGGTTAMQGELHIVAVTGAWDLARDHFGCHVPLMHAASAEDAMLALEDGRASVAVLPLPEDDDPAPWWMTLAEAGDSALRVILRLPFGALGNADPSCAEAFGVAPFAPEPSGEDCTLVAILTTEPLRQATVTDAFLGASLRSNPVAAVKRKGRAASLVQLDGEIAPDDRRLAAALKPLGAGARAQWLGLYARPLPDAVLGGIAPE